MSSVGIQSKGKLLKPGVGAVRNFDIRNINIHVEKFRVASTDTSEKTSIGGLIGNILHGFIKSDMLRSLDVLRFDVIVDGIFHGLGVAEEDASARIRDSLIRTFLTGGQSIDAAAKDTQKTKMGLLAGTDLIRRCFGITMNSDVVKAKKMMKGVRPELGG